MGCGLCGIEFRVWGLGLGLGFGVEVGVGDVTFQTPEVIFTSQTTFSAVSPTCTPESVSRTPEWGSRHRIVQMGLAALNAHQCLVQ